MRKPEIEPYEKNPLKRFDKYLEREFPEIDNPAEKLKTGDEKLYYEGYYTWIHYGERLKE